MKKKFEKLEKKLDLEFKDKNLLIQAFCHRSYLNENPDFELGQNERLEFLGDAVMELVVTEYLFRNYPDNPEGDLTDWRAALVNTKMISEVARKLKLGKYLLLSNGEKKERGKAKQYMLADTFEALIGAIYIDSGYNAAKRFIKKYLLVELPEIISLELFKDPKSELQEVAQEKTGITPTYEIVDEKGPDHDKRFRMGVFLEDEKLAEGEGGSKKEAEEEAAQKALEKKFNK
ncbi:MAG: ribonuclease III [Patescibacteria group bacterium]